MMDVLHVTSAHVVKDTRIFVKEARSLAKAGLNVGIVGPGPTYLETQSQGVTLITLPAPKRRLARFTTFAISLDRIVRQIRPNIVHIHDPDLLGIARVWKRRGIKIVYDVHEDFPKALLSRSWLRPIWLRRAIAALTNKTERRALRWADGFVFADEHLATRFQGCHGVVIRNHLELSEWPRGPKETPDPKIIQCIYVGDITVARGLLRMCDATFTAAGQIHLHLVGPIPHELHARVARHPAKDCITLHGRKTRAEVATQLSKADVALCLPQATPAYVDALPVKILEYLYNRLPVVATQLPRLECELPLCPGLSLVPEDATSTELVEAITIAARASCPDLRPVLEQHYNWENEAKKLVRFYHSLLSRPELVQTRRDRLMTSKHSAISVPATKPPALSKTSTASLPK